MADICPSGSAMADHALPSTAQQPRDHSSTYSQSLFGGVTVFEQPLEDIELRSDLASYPSSTRAVRNKGAGSVSIAASDSGDDDTRSIMEPRQSIVRPPGPESPSSTSSAVSMTRTEESALLGSPLVTIYKVAFRSGESESPHRLFAQTSPDTDKADDIHGVYFFVSTPFEDCIQYFELAGPAPRHLRNLASSVPVATVPAHGSPDYAIMDRVPLEETLYGVEPNQHTDSDSPNERSGSYFDVDTSDEEDNSSDTKSEVSDLDVSSRRNHHGQRIPTIPTLASPSPIGSAPETHSPIGSAHSQPTTPSSSDNNITLLKQIQFGMDSIPDSSMEMFIRLCRAVPPPQRQFEASPRRYVAWRPLRRSCEWTDEVVLKASDLGIVQLDPFVAIEEDSSDL